MSNDEIKYFSDFDKIGWNNIICAMEGNVHLFSWSKINYYMNFDGMDNKSFIYFFEKKPVSAVILAIKKENKKKNHLYRNKNSFCPAPLFSAFKNESIRKKFYFKTFELIKNILLSNEITEYIFNKHPILNENNEKDAFEVNLSSKNLFFNLNIANIYEVVNYLIIELFKEETVLWDNLSFYRKKNIKKNSKKNIYTEIYTYLSEKKKIDEIFELFQNEHLKASGFKTRSDNTWLQMKLNLLANEADLFILKNNKNILSYLFCDRFNKICSGWSQVNVKEYEEEYSPRHTLEWEAIKYYKKINQKYYDIGPRYFNNNIIKYSNKELSISEFKEKFGSNYFPGGIFRLSFKS